MKITQIRIQNFRSLVDVTIPLANTTVLLGENNVGKTAVLDAVRYLLSHDGARRTSAIDEYDIHLADEQADPRASDGITIDATWRESEPREWPDALRDALSDVVQLDLTQLAEAAPCSINLRFSAEYDPESKGFVSSATFLNDSGQPLTGNPTVGLNRLLRYVPLFRLSAIRDPGDELSGRSKFWRPILKSLDLPDDQVEDIQQRMNRLNEQLLALDPRLLEVAKTLGRAGDVVATGTGERVQVRALPLKIWDLMSRSDIVVLGKGSNVAFPLLRHGQGLQSLAVLFLFEAFVSQLLELAYEPESEPVLTLEEPESHLHPQAARALWAQIQRLPGQHIISTHSPYFAQLVPIRDLRILRRRGAATTVHWLPKDACIKLDMDDATRDALSTFVDRQPDRFKLRGDTLIAKCPISKDHWRDLCVACPKASHPQLRLLREQAALLLTDNECHKLEQYVRRTRGELFFARCWLLIEGQSEHILLPRFAKLLDIDLDMLGISLIDYQNNGSPGAFVALARALNVPWQMLCDGDSGGCDHVENVEKLGISSDELDERISMLPGADLELYLARHFTEEMRAIAQTLGSLDDDSTPEQIAKVLRDNKTDAARLLAERLADTTPERVPELIRTTLKRCQKDCQ
ncbi:MAG: hypothetical protein Tsb0020_39620 [Haliangiales bacterium]